MSFILSKLFRLIVNSIFKNITIKPIDKAIKEYRENSNRSIGFEEVSRRVDRRFTYIKGWLIHLVVFIVTMVILRQFTGDNPYSTANFNLLGFGAVWLFFVLVPHGCTVFVYAIRWSPKELKQLERAKREEAERKRNSRSDYNFSEDWDR